MNHYCSGCLHQIEAALQKTIKMMQQLKEEELLLRPTPDKMSVGELLQHIATICRTDYYISLGYSQEKMTNIYEKNKLTSLKELEAEMKTSFTFLAEITESIQKKSSNNRSLPIGGQAIHALNG